VFHEEIIVHGTAIMLALRFGTRIAVQLDALSSSIFCVTRGRAWRPRTACASAEPKGKQQASTATAREANLPWLGIWAPFLMQGMARAGGQIENRPKDIQV